MHVLACQWHSIGISGAPVLDTIGIVCDDWTHGFDALEALYGKPNMPVKASDGIVVASRDTTLRA